MPSPPRPTEAKSKLPLLLALVAMLAGLLVWDRLSNASPENDVAKPAATARERSADAFASSSRTAPLASLSLNDLHDTVDRPLFEKGRRPVKPPVVQPVKAPPPPPPRGPDPNALELVGILAGEDQTIVLLKRRQSGQQVRVQQGDTVDGWTIDRIEPQRVILKHGATEVALQLFKSPSR
jgi:type II secretory pathway component PulC